MEKLGGYRKDRRTGVDGLTLAGLIMLRAGQAIREEFSNIFMDDCNETEVTLVLQMKKEAVGQTYVYWQKN